MTAEAFHIMIVSYVEYLKSVVIIALSLVENTRQCGSKACS